MNAATDRESAGWCTGNKKNKIRLESWVQFSEDLQKINSKFHAPLNEYDSWTKKHHDTAKKKVRIDANTNTKDIFYYSNS